MIGRQEHMADRPLVLCRGYCSVKGPAGLTLRQDGASTTALPLPSAHLPKEQVCGTGVHFLHVFQAGEIALDGEVVRKAGRRSRRILPARCRRLRGRGVNLRFSPPAVGGFVVSVTANH